MTAVITEVTIGTPVPTPTPTPTGTAIWPSVKRPEAKLMRPAARLRTVMILPPEPCRNPVNLVSAVVKVASVPALLTAAVDRSGKSRREIARAARMNKDTFLRALRGERAVTLDDAMRVLDASGFAPNGALLLAILGHEDLAVEWLGEDVGAFLDLFLEALPVTMSETLGPRIADLRPRWAIGTSRLVARLLAKHIDDFAERDISLVLGR